MNLLTGIEILEKLKIGETVDFECKAAQGGLPNSVWETYSAMANTNGGIILLGVSQENEEFKIIGIENPSNMLRDFWNTINNPSKVNVNLLVDKDVEVMELENKQIICISVPRSDYKLKPVFIGENPFKGTFRRNYEGDYRCG